MKKLLKTLLTLVVGLTLLSSCNKKEESYIYSMYAVLYDNLGMSYMFKLDNGKILYPNNDLGILDHPSGSRLYITFSCNPDIFMGDNPKGDIIEIRTVPTYDIGIYAPDSLSRGAFVSTVGSPAYPNVICANNYLTVEFPILYNDAKKHTFGFMQDGANYYQNDTMYIRMWHNARGDGKGTMELQHIAINLSGMYIQNDSVVIALKCDIESSYGSFLGEKTIYSVYKRGN